MRNLIAFLQRFRIFLVFLILQFFALASYFSVVSYPRTKYLNSSSAVIGFFTDIKHDVTKHFKLEEDNIALQRELQQLQEKQMNNYIPVNSGEIKIKDTLLKLQYEFIPATITDGTYNYKDNFFTLNKGRLAGVYKDMGVVSANGIIGIVYDVSDHYSVVKSILNSAINIPVKIEGINAKGLLKWEMPDRDPLRIKLTGISNDIPIPRGAKVVTSGSSKIFPKNYEVGRIEITKLLEGKPEWDATVRLGNDLRTTESVFVIKNLMKLEIEALEDKIKEELNIQ